MSRLFFGVLENALKIMPALMVVLVFGNVVLRYGFNSGITISEELSRFLFVWLIFIGAFVTLRDRGHLGVNGLVRLLPYRGQWAVRVFGDAASLLCCLLLGHRRLRGAGRRGDPADAPVGLSGAAFGGPRLLGRDRGAAAAALHPLRRLRRGGGAFGHPAPPKW